MALEKAFAIKASPAAIWDALTADLASGDESAYRIERAIAGQELALWVELQGGIRALLTYRLVPRADHTEVVATMSPEGLRYALFRILTLGRADTNYELVLVQGLANLKRAVEGEPGDDEATVPGDS
ncbi:MAG: hypothetical protein WEE64_07280 [Dehalococcoidia bacterium]